MKTDLISYLETKKKSLEFVEKLPELLVLNTDKSDLKPIYDYLIELVKSDYRNEFGLLISGLL